MMGEVGRAYAGVRERMTALAADADPGALIPACPEWSMTNLLAHVTGVVDDALAGRLEGVTTEAWTAAQVASRLGRSVQEILAEWTEKAPGFEHMLDAVGALGEQAVFDVTTHEHDLRGGLGRPGARESDAVGIASAWLGRSTVDAIEKASLPALRIRTAEGDEWACGRSAETTLIGSRFELLRALSGRRSRAQIRALRWHGDPDVYLGMFEYGPFVIPDHDLVE